MGRGYWLPPQYQNLAAFDGFFVRAEAIYSSTDTDVDWNRFLEQVEQYLCRLEPSFQIYNTWKAAGNNRSRFVLLQNSLFTLIAEDDEHYVAG